ncbi:MAG TPA: hypothetical protein VGD40_20330 [Chryseosolibacter sp.]
MKKLSIGLLLLCCTLLWAQSKLDIKEIEFSKIARGYEEHVRVNPDSVHVLIHDVRGEKPATNFSRKLEKEEWVKLMDIAKSIKVSEIESLPSPTMKRASDAAMHGTLTLTTGKDKSYSHGFDDENPHDSLKPLLQAVREISGRKETK